MGTLYGEHVPLANLSIRMVEPILLLQHYGEIVYGQPLNTQVLAMPAERESLEEMMQKVMPRLETVGRIPITHDCETRIIEKRNINSVGHKVP